MPDHAHDSAQSMRTDLSNAIVRSTREHTRRGPTRSRTIVDREAVVVLLHDSLTRGEDVLIEHGQSDQVLQLRRTFQEAMRPDYVAAIEEVVGRHVVAFLSTNSTDPDVAAEIFLLGDPIVTNDASTAPTT